jgi:transposase
MTGEAKAKLSQSLSGRSYANRKGQRVRELKSGLEFGQAVQAAKHFGVSKSTVSRSIRQAVEITGLRFEALD